MDEQKSTSRLDTLITVCVVIISIVMAIVIWRTSMANSDASGTDRRGMINLIKQQAALNENVRKLYEEMFSTREYVTFLSEIETLEKSGNEVAAQVADLYRRALPGYNGFSPMITDAKYKNPDGTYNLALRLEDLNKEFPETSLKPEESFTKADSKFTKQRLLTVDAIILTLSLFWVSVAQVAAGKFRLFSLAIGVLIFFSGLGAFGLIELFV